MTRQEESISDLRNASTVVFEPIRHGRSLTDEVIARILEEITSGRLIAGQRLPTEQEMMNSMKVSRTVVREAISALKARGMVITRQGSGAFVSAESHRGSYAPDPEMIRSLDTVINVLELRLAVEAEAAGLACARAAAPALSAIEAAHAAFVAAIDNGESGADEDFAFHLAIASATGNPQFPEFLKFLGAFVIPRQNLKIWTKTFSSQSEYLARIKQEHDGILTAILGRSPAAARDAMRVHLTLAAARYRRFATPGAAEEINIREEAQTP